MFILFQENIIDTVLQRATNMMAETFKSPMAVEQLKVPHQKI